VDLEFEKLEEKSFQGTSVKNFCDLEVPYTRVHEFKFLHPERLEALDQNSTIIAREYSRLAKINDEPYYPINSSEDRTKLSKYRKLAESQKNVYFGGRLGSYQYLDMHMAIASALTIFENDLKPRLKNHA
jgi:UDP-galactopyranose mutase